MVSTIHVEDMSDKLEAALSEAAKHITEDYHTHHSCSSDSQHCTCRSDFEKDIREILVARIYIPMMEISE